MKQPASFVAGVAAGLALAAAIAWGPVPLWAGQTQKPSATSASGHSSRVVLENDRVRVKEVIFPAGVTSTGQHTHELPHVGVILTAGSLVFTEQGKSDTVTFAAGDVGFRPAKATHDVGNPGTGNMRVIEVEIK